MKILILGGVGSGKTTFSKKLGRRLGIKVYHLDFMVFDENWKKRNKGKKLELLKESVAKKNWIIEGHSVPKWAERALDKCDKILVLEHRKSVLVWRVFKRFFLGVKEGSAYGALWSLISCLKHALSHKSENYSKIKEDKRCVALKSNENIEKYLLS